MRYLEETFQPSYLMEEAPTGELPAPHEGEEHGGEGEEEKVPFGSPRFWLFTGISIGLTCFAGAMSGLTVGLLSIDKLELEMKLENGSD